MICPWNSMKQESDNEDKIIGNQIKYLTYQIPNTQHTRFQNLCSSQCCQVRYQSNYCLSHHWKIKENKRKNKGQNWRKDTRRKRRETALCLSWDTHKYHKLVNWQISGDKVPLNMFPRNPLDQWTMTKKSLKE